jgi:hypothetical protein
MKRYPEETAILPNDFKFWEYKIIVPNQETANELAEALKYIHDLKKLDTGFVIVNQLAHEYEDFNNIIIQKEIE